MIRLNKPTVRSTNERTILDVEIVREGLTGPWRRPEGGVWEIVVRGWINPHTEQNKSWDVLRNGTYGGFHSHWGIENGWFLCSGKSHLEIDDNLGYPYFRKPTSHSSREFQDKHRTHVDLTGENADSRGKNWTLTGSRPSNRLTGKCPNCKIAVFLPEKNIYTSVMQFKFVVIQLPEDIQLLCWITMYQWISSGHST